LLPKDCYPLELVVLNFKNVGVPCPSAHLSENDLQMFTVPVGYYPIKVYLRTRFAIFLIFIGLGKKLKNPLNWHVVYRDA
jgi:hypothetical protein